MWEKIVRIWKIEDIRRRVLFVIGMLVIFRVTAHIPVPGVDPGQLRDFLAGNQILGLLNIFSGGTIQNFSLVMLGVAPYITASIIFQLLTMVVPQLEEMSKEGESGQQKINQYTRLASVPLALLQAFGLLQLLRQSQGGVLGALSQFEFIAILLTVTAGTVFLMWIGELITEKNVGNGISLLIFAGIIAALPIAVQNVIVNYNPADLYTYVLFVVIALLTVVGVVLINEAQRNIPITYAKQARGLRATHGGVQSHLPLRLNMAGVIPIIFAISVVLFPPMIAQFLINKSGFLGDAANWIVAVFNNQLIYGIMYFVLVFGFTYFYTAVIFKPDKIAENLQRQGAFIPGIRPGTETEKYLGNIMHKLVFFGALFLGIIAILPLVVQGLTGSQSLVVGGTSLLIVVSVAVETAKQIEAQLTMYEYDHA